ncbi:hypothetical protein ARMGADRAFT_1040549 [Armillaria gallica]|uniref:Uncharacterized protein n=1 Tax=Armillaria gallica TaxID=47427 RepID=A0A2H3CMZ2_ARMGA|nr:hypothetical protein ARMGADRAFT_1040549 [Armillaria gallica]
MANDALARDGPYNEMQPNGSTYELFSPDGPQLITNLPVSKPHMVGTLYSPPTSDDEDIDQLVEDKPQSAPVNAGYSRFQFMPGNTTSQTYKMVFYPGDKGTNANSSLQSERGFLQLDHIFDLYQGHLHGFKC